MEIYKLVGAGQTEEECPFAIVFLFCSKGLEMGLKIHPYPILGKAEPRARGSPYTSDLHPTFWSTESSNAKSARTPFENLVMLTSWS